jgi:hypothetical protein
MKECGVKIHIEGEKEDECRRVRIQGFGKETAPARRMIEDRVALWREEESERKASVERTEKKTSDVKQSKAPVAHRDGGEWHRNTEDSAGLHQDDWKRGTRCKFQERCHSGLACPFMHDGCTSVFVRSVLRSVSLKTADLEEYFAKYGKVLVRQLGRGFEVKVRLTPKELEYITGRNHWVAGVKLMVDSEAPQSKHRSSSSYRLPGDWDCHR